MVTADAPKKRRSLEDQDRWGNRVPGKRLTERKFAGAFSRVSLFEDSPYSGLASPYNDLPHTPQHNRPATNVSDTKAWTVLIVVGLAAVMGAVWWYSEQSAGASTQATSSVPLSVHPAVQVQPVAARTKATEKPGKELDDPELWAGQAPESGTVKRKPKQAPQRKDDSVHTVEVLPVAAGHVVRPAPKQQTAVDELQDGDTLQHVGDETDTDSSLSEVDGGSSETLVDSIDGDAVEQVHERQVSPMEAAISSQLEAAEVAYARKIRIEAEAAAAVEPLDGQSDDVKDVEDRGKGGRCSDHERECSYWASLGECTGNTKWMDLHCCQSCRRQARKIKTCIDEEPECTYWASLGECSTNEETMKVKCCQTCSKVMDINYGLPDR